MGNVTTPETMAILECLAEGHKPGAVSDLLGVPVSQVYNAKRNHPDVICELQGKKPDGTPARFAPGCGAESIAKMERVEERGTGNPSPTEETGGNRKHSIAELFQEIEALKVEKIQLLEKVKAREDELAKVSEMLAIEQRERKRGVMEIRLTDLLPIMCYDLLREEIDPEYVRGYLSALNSIFKYDDIRKEREKNARPEEN
ncbi:hypothetical protein [Candidatus Proelusimicrobium excrementi]|uniref:hypothetical protein n=1 Tax=Candidatus Proelusimicrobium excrementi TaxID=3416222 RepID=UPI003CAF6BED|nr:hypothetical protein [Elusimicrobiaceae bacterium]MBR3927707.1 hypothetical protein [Clostridia bacterium]